MSLEELKREYIGKIYGYLTIEDVYRDDDHCKWMFRCKCVCGNKINLQLNKVHFIMVSALEIIELYLMEKN